MAWQDEHTWHDDGYVAPRYRRPPQTDVGAVERHIPYDAGRHRAFAGERVARINR